MALICVSYIINITRIYDLFEIVDANVVGICFITKSKICFITYQKRNVLEKVASWYVHYIYIKIRHVLILRYVMYFEMC